MDIIITGASRGIGAYLFEHLESETNRVYGTYNSSSETNSKFLYKLDIRDENEVQKWIDSLDLGRDVVLINCAGITYNKFAHKSDMQSWRNVIDVNLIGTFNVIHKILPLMRENMFGRIINFSSIAAQVGTPGVSAYAASKSALWGLSKTIAVENASKGITINNINLGYADIGMGIDSVPASFKNQIRERIPNKEFCDPSQILNTVNYLISNNYVNGTGIDINGGLY
ncbi:MAG: SDR family NAD(P)-dependent oxidoreductase [Marinifilaceae bacterium]